jgi:molybdopterin-guanine dinucleotide biosynthesis protein A
MAREKSLLPIGGRSLIENIIAQIDAHFGTILISAGDRKKFAFLGLPVVEDDMPGQGPLTAVWTVLRVSPCPVNFVIACDIPVINIPFVEKILSLAPKYEIVAPRYRDGKFEPLFAAYSRSVVPAIARQVAAGDYRISSLFRTCRTKFVAMDGQKWFRNLNTIEEYHAYLQSGKKNF